MDVRILLIPKRENPPEQSVQYRETCRSLLEETRRKHPGESHRWKYRETCGGNVDYRIPGVPDSTIQKEDSNRKETVKRPIQQLENHPNRDSSQSVQQSRRSRSPAWATRNTSSFARPLLRYNALIALYIGKRASPAAHAASACSLQKGIDR